MAVACKFVKVLTALVLAALPIGAAAQCRQALVLALDVSGSVDATEYHQQLTGIANALTDPEVMDLVLSNPDAPVAMMVFEWSSENHQIVLEPWRFLRTASDVHRLAQTIATIPRHRAGLKTGMGKALTFAGLQLEKMSACWTLTVDISSDGRNNVGSAPTDAYRAPIFKRTTVNGLIVGGPADGAPSQSAPALETYFQENVLHGPSAFSITAQGYSDYARAMRLKLMRELQPMMLGRLVDPPKLPL